MLWSFASHHDMKTWPHRCPLEMCPPSHVGAVARDSHCDRVTDYLRCHKFQSDTLSSPEVMPAHSTSHIMPVYQRSKSCCINKSLSDALSLTHSSSLSSHTFHFMFCFTISHTDIISLLLRLFSSSLCISVVRTIEASSKTESYIFVHHNTLGKISVYRVRDTFV